MTLTIGTEKIPIRLDEDGVARVGGTRVTLDTIIDAYEREHSAERIVAQYDVLTLADVHYVIGYYLSHRSEVDAYLADRLERSEGVRHMNESRFSPEGVRDRLSYRKSQGK
jgi:uncharacterized protein (DUF433 family)